MIREGRIENRKSNKVERHVWTCSQNAAGEWLVKSYWNGRIYVSYRTTDEADAREFLRDLREG